MYGLSLKGLPQAWRQTPLPWPISNHTWTQFQSHPTQDTIPAGAIVCLLCLPGGTPPQKEVFKVTSLGLRNMTSYEALPTLAFPTMLSVEEAYVSTSSTERT